MGSETGSDTGETAQPRSAESGGEGTSPMPMDVPLVVDAAPPQTDAVPPQTDAIPPLAPIDAPPSEWSTPAAQPYPIPPAQGWLGYGQTPPNPYDYPQYVYGAPEPPAGTNGMAIAALVLGICGFLMFTSIVGLILGIVALSAIRKSGQRGKGLAIGGIVLSSLFLSMFAAGIVVGMFASSGTAHRDANGTVVSSGTAPVTNLHPKDCFTAPAGLSGSAEIAVRNLHVMPCSTPHDSEVIGSFTASGADVPGTDAIHSEASIECAKLLGTYVLDPESLPADSMVQFIFPNAQAWKAGERQATCFIQFSGAITQSVQRDESSYTADQLRYLSIVHPVFRAVTQLHVRGDSAPTATLRWEAGDVAAAMEDEVSALTAMPWPADVQQAVDNLAANHRTAATLWRKAAAAPDTAAVRDGIRQAGSFMNPEDIRAVRAALGLTTIAPGTSG